MTRNNEIRQLLEHYAADRLSPDELIRLRRLLASDREAVAAVLDEELAAAQHPDLTDDDLQLLAQMQAKLHAAIAQSPDAPQKPEGEAKTIPLRTLLLRSRLLRFTAYAAALIIPLLLAATLYFGYDAASLGRQTLRIATRQGERTTLTLPDGSTVSLNPVSQVSYQASDFSRRSRSISYEGDGAFDIAKQSGAPFVIRSKQVEVRVLGTKFIFSARPEAATAKVYLEEGRVEVTALSSGRTVTMKPHDMVEVDCASGRITLSEGISHSALAALKKGELVFRDEPLADVVKQLEINYDYSFRLDGSLAQSRFTGILPTDNILETIRILEVTFGISSDISEREIMLYKHR
jgi:ferric-dicitrate binding protein FerR (iron transport regulator)